MEVNNENELDDLIRKSVKTVGLDSPSADFTKNLISKIEMSSELESITTYKPLISKAGWVIMAVIVLALSVFALDYKLDILLAWLDKMNFGALPELHLLEVLPQLAISNIFFYGLFIFAIFALIQMVFLKQRLDKQYV